MDPSNYEYLQVSMSLCEYLQVLASNTLNFVYFHSMAITSFSLPFFGATMVSVVSPLPLGCLYLSPNVVASSSHGMTPGNSHQDHNTMLKVNGGVQKRVQ